MATVEDNKIILSETLFDLGKKQIVAALIEEYSHLKSNQGDRTRGFQDFLIEQLIGVLEDKTKIYL